jgi:DNA-binding transcriptional LysR family regulator
MIDRALRQMQIRPQEEMILDNQRVILSMVERGLGTAIVPMSPQLAQEIPLTCLPFGTPHMTRHIVMLERPGHSGGQLAAAMAEVMIDLAGSRTC